MKTVYKALILCFFCTLIGCDLTRSTEIDLPTYEFQPVVECYLERGKPMQLLLTNSYSFFAPFDTQANDYFNSIVLNSALVTISYQGQTDTLLNGDVFDAKNNKYYNYYNPKMVKGAAGTEYQLFIKLNTGQTITASTQMPQKAHIDSVTVDWSYEPSKKARTIMYWSDDPNSENYYRLLLNQGSLSDPPLQDILLSDQAVQNNTMFFPSLYYFKKGDTCINSLVNIPKDYYAYLESAKFAIQANISPLAQPSIIKSNVSGSANPLGIFTCVSIERDTTIIN